MTNDPNLVAESFLYLPQKQNWKPSVLLGKRIVTFSKCILSRQSGSATRLALANDGTVAAGQTFTDWEKFWQWDIEEAFKRLQQLRVTPMELEIEFQEEVFLRQWHSGGLTCMDEGYDLLAMESGALPFSARLDRGPSGTPLHDTFVKLAKAEKHPAIYGVSHYESCRVMFQPLTALGKEGPEYLTLSFDNVSSAEVAKQIMKKK